MTAIAREAEPIRPSNRGLDSPIARVPPAVTSLLESERTCERLLTSYLALLREIHDKVIQDLFGVALTLESMAENCTPEVRDCAANVRGVLTELRSMLDEATPDSMPPDPTPTARPRFIDTVRGETGEMPSDLAIDAITSASTPVCSTVVNFVAEGVRNAMKHAKPTCVSVNANFESGVLRVSMENDGVRHGSSEHGSGLRLLGLDVQRLGGVLSVQHDDELWQLTLTLPVAASS